MSKKTFKKRNSPRLGDYTPLPFNVNEANMAAPVNVDAVSQDGWNPNDNTKYLMADDLNVFMFRTNFTGDLKSVINMDTTSGSGNIPTTGTSDYYNLYNVSAPDNGFTIDVNTSSMANGTTIKIYNSGDYPIKINQTSASTPTYNIYIFSKCLATITVVKYGLFQDFIFNSTSQLALPIANTGQIVPYLGSDFLTKEFGFIPCIAGTIGSAATTATICAEGYAFNLFYYLWNTFSDTYCPVSGGRGGAAVSDWGANKTIALPNFSGNVIAVANGSSYANGETFGTATVSLTADQNGPHTHGTSPASPVVQETGGDGATGGGGLQTVGLSILSSGLGSPHENRQPTIAIPHYIKL